MGNSVFPVLRGRAWGSAKVPQFSTRIQKAVSGKELRAALMAYPLYKFNLSYTYLRSRPEQQDLQAMIGFFLARRGSFDSFLYTDPDDNAVTGQPFGTGDGVTRSFQLVRTLGSFIEPTENINGTPAIYVNGVATAAFTLGATGIVTFNVAPANGTALTWSGAYYFRCRFQSDDQEYKKFMKDLWNLGKVEFIGATGNKV